MTDTGADTRLFLARPPVSAGRDSYHASASPRAPLRLRGERQRIASEPGHIPVVGGTRLPKPCWRSPGTRRRRSSPAHNGIRLRLFFDRPLKGKRTPHDGVAPGPRSNPILDGPLSESLLGRPNSPRWHGIPRRRTAGAFSCEANMTPIPAEVILYRYGKTPEQLAEDLHCLAERIAKEVELSFAEQRVELAKEVRP